MRLAFIGPFALHPKGTVSVRILSLARMLKENGHEVLVLLPPYDNPKHSGTYFTVDGVDILNVSIPKTQLLNYLFITGLLVKKALEFRPDILHIFKPKGYSGLAGMFLIFLKYLKLIRIPIVIDTDDWEGYGGFANYYIEHGLYPKIIVNFFDFQERWLLEHGDIVTAASKVLKSRALTLRKNSNPDRVFYIPNGPTDLPVYEIGSNAEIRKSLRIEDKKIMLLYTRFFEYDIEEVIDILDRVISRNRDVMLLIVGKGKFQEEEKLLNLAKERGLLQHVVYVGWVKPRKIASYIRIGDVAIYPFKDTLLNRSKCPGKLVQLMSFGKAIVADAVGQISEYIEHEKSGILVKPGDTEEFANWVLKLFEKKGLRKRIGESARERIWSLFNWKKLSKEVELAYELGLS